MQGLTAAGAYADEAALFPQNFIDQMMGRCSVEGSKVWMNCNPENSHNYINEEFIRKAKKKRVYPLHFMMEDNLTLSKKKIEEYKRKWPHSSVFYKRFILGRWVAAEGLIYQQFADNVKDYLITSEWLMDNPILYAVIGVDFGGTKSAHSFTLTGFARGYKQVVVLDEYYRKGRINPKQLQDDFIDFVKRTQSKFKVYEAYCDNAEQTLIAGLEMACMEAHVAIDIKNAIKGPINDRIAFYNSLIAQNRWKIMKHCKNIREVFENAVYDDTKKNEDGAIYFPIAPWKDSSYGEPDGILGINCRHHKFMFFPGKSIRRYFPTEDMEENNRLYKQMQVQRAYERAVREQKRLCMELDSVGDAEGFQEASVKLKQKEAKLKEYVDKHEFLHRKKDREQVVGFGRSHSARAVAVKKRIDKYGAVRYNEDGTVKVTDD